MVKPASVTIRVVRMLPMVKPGMLGETYVGGFAIASLSMANNVR